MERIRPDVAQAFETSSIVTRERSAPVPRPPCSSEKKRPKIPCSRKSSTTSQGKACVASISAPRAAELALLVGEGIPGHLCSNSKRFS
jgi:hypothetical protein